MFQGIKVRTRRWRGPSPEDWRGPDIRHRAEEYPGPTAFITEALWKALILQSEICVTGWPPHLQLPGSPCSLRSQLLASGTTGAWALCRLGREVASMASKLQGPFAGFISESPGTGKRGEQWPSYGTAAGSTTSGTEASSLQPSALHISGPLRHVEKWVGQVVAHSRAQDHTEENPGVVGHNSQHHKVANYHLNDMD